MPEAAREETGARLSIGALSRATGIPVETLRTWESRYGFPAPERRPSGHREYPVSSVPRLRRVAEALARGHRARQVVPASEAVLRQLLATPSVPAAPAPSLPAAGDEVAGLLRIVQSLDADRLTRALTSAATRLGPLSFVDTVVAPLLRAVGEGWETGRLQVRHEHLLSERVGDVLRSLRLAHEDGAAGPPFVLATPPGEAHGLGLQMAALVIASAGGRVLYLGTETPVDDMVSLTRDRGARALALSLSASSHGSRSRALVRRLRAALPRRTALVVGGAGAPPASRGVLVLPGLRPLDGWVRELMSVSRGTPS